MYTFLENIKIVVLLNPLNALKLIGTENLQKWLNVAFPKVTPL